MSSPHHVLAVLLSASFCTASDVSDFDKETDWLWQFADDSEAWDGTEKAWEIDETLRRGAKEINRLLRGSNGEGEGESDDVDHDVEEMTNESNESANRQAVPTPFLSPAPPMLDCQETCESNATILQGWKKTCERMECSTCQECITRESETPEPTEEPTDMPTEERGEEPTEEPTEVPTPGPTDEPTYIPTLEPTDVPTYRPTEEPTITTTIQPTATPSSYPTGAPTSSPTSERPTPERTAENDTILTPQPTAAKGAASSLVPTPATTREGPVANESEPRTPYPTEEVAYVYTAVYGNADTTSCPQNSVEIGDAADCYATAIAEGRTWQRSGPFSKLPKGCFLYETGTVYFNTHPAGAPSSDAQPICLLVKEAGLASTPAPTMQADANEGGTEAPDNTSKPINGAKASCASDYSSRRRNGYLCADARGLGWCGIPTLGHRRRHIHSEIRSTCETTCASEVGCTVGSTPAPTMGLTEGPSQSPTTSPTTFTTTVPALAVAVDAGAIQPRATPTLAPRQVIMSMKVENVDYDALASNETLISSFTSAVKDALALEAGDDVLPEHVDVELSAGSVQVNASINPPEHIAVVELASFLSASTTLAETVVSQVAAIDQIEAVSIGSIRVSGIFTHYQTPAPKSSPARSPTSVPTPTPSSSATHAGAREGDAESEVWHTSHPTPAPMSVRTREGSPPPVTSEDNGAEGAEVIVAAIGAGVFLLIAIGFCFYHFVIVRKCKTPAALKPFVSWAQARWAIKHSDDNTSAGIQSYLVDSGEAQTRIRSDVVVDPGNVASNTGGVTAQNSSSAEQANRSPIRNRL